ncbi:MAG: hypothetical protein V5A68_05020, partial [Candidatus Thermoplasmatota archaeon]
ATGEAGDDNVDGGYPERYPNHYNSSTFNSHNSISHYVEFACEIPIGQWAGKYSTHVYYRLKTQTE